MSDEFKAWIDRAMWLAEELALTQHDHKNEAAADAARDALRTHLQAVPNRVRPTRVPLPAVGTLERILIDKMASMPPGEGVTYLDFVGTGITEENIDQLVQNLKNGMYRSEEDDVIKFDA